MKFGFVFLSSLFFISTHLLAQHEEDYVIQKKDNNESIYEKNIYGNPNPDYTSYLISPSAYTISKRDFRIAANDFIFYKLTYGITNNTNISVNTSLFGTLIGSIKQSFSIDEDRKIAFSASFGDFTAALKDTNIWFGGCDANYTMGNHQNHFTIGTGFYTVKSNLEIVQRSKLFYVHCINFGVQKQISNKTFLVFDGYYFTNFGIFTGSGGFKFIIKKRYALNAGLMPVLWNNIRQSRHSIKPFIIPVISLRMLIERKD